MSEVKLYEIRRKCNPWLNYYFDKLTGFFIKSKIKTKIKDPKKILLIRNDHVGDMVYSTQVFREVKRIFPNVKISVIATVTNRAIIEKDKNVDDIIEIDLFWRRGLKGFQDYFRVLKKIKKENFDVGVDLRASKLNMLFFLFLPRIKNRIAYYNVTGGKAFLTHPILYEKKINVIKEYIQLIEKSFNVKIKNYMPHVIFNKEDEREVRNLLSVNDIKKYFVISPGATADSKRWPEKKFEELINEIHKKYPRHKIIVSGANSDRELIERLCNGRKKFCLPLINLSLRKMAVVFKNAEVTIANNGAGVDISWVADGKLVYLAGPVNLITDKPLKNTKVLHHRLPCYPCKWDNDCERPCGKWCMDLITVEEVMKAIDDFVAKKK